MTLTDFYLVCFLVGILLSVLTFVLGSLHIHLHLPFHMHVPGMHAPHVHVPHGGASASTAQSMSDLPYINFGTITAFLAWFGGIGYLLSRHSHLAAAAALGLSFVAGITGSTIVFMLVGKLLMTHDRALDPMDYDMIGVLGRVTSTIRESGTGEIVFSQEGTRRSAGARSENGSAISKGEEVVVTKFEKGIAYVRRWDELNASTDVNATNSAQ